MALPGDGSTHGRILCQLTRLAAPVPGCGRRCDDG
jgi:hypothetical protein